MAFKNKICFESVSFKYPSGSFNVVNDINLTIEYGEIVGIMGKTGSGKSTLADILMGLLRPTTGEVLVDGIPLKPENINSWQSIIAHVLKIFILQTLVSPKILPLE